MMSIIWFLIIGLVAGLIARLIMPGKDAMGLIATMLLGVVGSFLGGAISWAIWGGGTARNGIQPSGLLMSIVGAFVVLLAWRMIKSRSSI
jgi:uncharacterized membrane protein YeaQ/YmgE (transglycosylase-associated protein family)